MIEPAYHQKRAVPWRVLASAGLALAAPAACALLAPDALGGYRPTLWLLALIPVLWLAHDRGRRGAAAAAVAGFTLVVLIEFVAVPGDPALRDPRMVRTVTALFLVIALGIIALAKRYGDILATYRRGEHLRRLEAAVETMQLGVTVTDLKGLIRYVNPADAAQHGYAVHELLGRRSDIYAPGGSREGAGPRDLSGITSWERERTDVRRDGTLFPTLLHSDVVMGADGAPVGVVTVCENITGRKHAEREAARAAERERSLQVQLSQAQKMDAVGRLAGGVAHDFNNVLTVILAEAEIALTGLPDQAPADEPAARSLRASFLEILRAGRRASDLTRQLLTFSRRQMTVPTVFGLNDLLGEMEEPVRRLVRDDVEVLIRGTARPDRVRADRSQIEHVVLSLAANARDAMPAGGRLVLETALATVGVDDAMLHPRLAPGTYVVLGVSDSGTGMSEEVRARIFEPFFTTKGEGKGTGLGLATAYGIVGQAGGRIEVESASGVGTTMKVFLPLTEALHAAARPAATRGAQDRGGETILLVEDDEGVRGLVLRMLRASGYAVLESADAEDALRLLEARTGPVHLLLTDVMLPRMNGRMLAERVRILRPGTKALLMSGYTDDAILRHEMIEGGLPLLHKPFTPSALFTRIREVLDSPTARSAA
jgi:two-component system cell cycle sensor histidine kinase/response regulator CckA